MQNQIVLIISHSPVVSNKILLSSIQQKGLDTKLAVVVNFKGEDHIGNAQYNIELHVLDKKSITQEQEILKINLPEPHKNFSLEEAVNIFFEAIKTVKPSLKGHSLSNVFDCHLFVEANLSRPAHDNITKQFHDAIHFVGNQYARLVNFAKSNFYVYGFSDTPEAVQNANKYFENEEINGLKHEMYIDKGIADSKRGISQHVQCKQGENIQIPSPAILNDKQTQATDRVESSSNVVPVDLSRKSEDNNRKNKVLKENSSSFFSSNKTKINSEISEQQSPDSQKSSDNPGDSCMPSSCNIS